MTKLTPFEFNTNYELCTIDCGLPDGQYIELLPKGSSGFGPEIWIRCNRHNDETAWFARVVGAQLEPATKGLFATPSPDWALIVFGCSAFLVHTANPTEYQELPTLIRNVHAAPTPSAPLVLTTDTTLIFIHADGTWTQSIALVGDALQVTEITDRVVRGTGHIGWKPYTQDFKVNLPDPPTTPSG